MSSISEETRSDYYRAVCEWEGECIGTELAREKRSWRNQEKLGESQQCAYVCVVLVIVCLSDTRNNINNSL